MREIIVSDESMEEIGQLILENGKQMNDALVRFLNIMKKVRSDGIMEGAAAKALDAFISQAEELKDMMEDTGNAANSSCQRFVGEIDEADQGLY